MVAHRAVAVLALVPVLPTAAAVPRTVAVLVAALPVEAEPRVALQVVREVALAVAPVVAVAPREPSDAPVVLRDVAARASALVVKSSSRWKLPPLAACGFARAMVKPFAWLAVPR